MVENFEQGEFFNPFKNKKTTSKIFLSTFEVIFFTFEAVSSAQLCPD